MSANTNASPDWVGGTRTKLVAWGLPHAALVAGLLVMVPARTAIWIAALAWMGVACTLNARRCGRTHCRFTRPYYLVMILPVLALRLGAVPAGLSGWLILGAFIIHGGKAIWWATERAGGSSRSTRISFSGSGASLVIITFNELAAARRGLFPFGKGRRQSGSGKAMNQMPINGATRKLKRPPRLPQGDGPAQTGGGLARSATSRHFAALPAVRLKE